MADPKWPPMLVEKVARALCEMDKVGPDKTNMIGLPAWLMWTGPAEVAEVAISIVADYDDPISSFAMRLGFVMGSLKGQKTIDYLKSKGVSQESIDRAYEALIAVAGAFYREDG